MNTQTRVTNLQRELICRIAQETINVTQNDVERGASKEPRARRSRRHDDNASEASTSSRRRSSSSTKLSTRKAGTADHKAFEICESLLKSPEILQLLSSVTHEACAAHTPRASRERQVVSITLEELMAFNFHHPETWQAEPTRSEPTRLQKLSQMAADDSPYIDVKLTPDEFEREDVREKLNDAFHNGLRTLKCTIEVEDTKAFRQLRKPAYHEAIVFNFHLIRAVKIRSALSLAEVSDAKDDLPLSVNLKVDNLNTFLSDQMDMLNETRVHRLELSSWYHLSETNAQAINTRLKELRGLRELDLSRIRIGEQAKVWIPQRVNSLVLGDLDGVLNFAEGCQIQSLTIGNLGWNNIDTNVVKVVIPRSVLHLDIGDCLGQFSFEEGSLCQTIKLGAIVPAKLILEGRVPESVTKIEIGYIINDRYNKYFVAIKIPRSGTLQLMTIGERVYTKREIEDAKAGKEYISHISFV